MQTKSLHLGDLRLAVNQLLLTLLIVRIPHTPAERRLLALDPVVAIQKSWHQAGL